MDRSLTCIAVDGEPVRLAQVDAAALVDRALSAHAFVARPLSWTAVHEGFFLKIARCSDSPRADLTHDRARFEADYEFRATASLSALVDAVPVPVALVQGCFIARAIAVKDVRDELLSRPSPAAARRVIDEAFTLMGELHRASRDSPPAFPHLDYARERLWDGPDDVLALLARRPRTVVARGLEIRNLLREGASGRMRFVDPHEVGLGAPEEDVARMILSLLMLRWGRRSVSGPWTAFSLSRALGIYATAYERPDPRVLSAMMRLNVVMRREHAESAARRLPPLMRPAGALYVRWFFSRLERWSRSNGL